MLNVVVADGRGYVCSGALLKCSRGATPSSLTAFSARSVKIQHHTAAVYTDAIPLANVMSFGGCMITKMPCIPVTFSWSGYQQHVLFGGNHALTDQSYLRCTIGGKITVQHSGQYTRGKVVTRAGKAGRYAARMDLLDRVAAKMNRVVPPEVARRDATRVAGPTGPGVVGAGAAGVAAARLREYNKAVERARLSQHVYSLGPDGKPTTPPPPGWKLLSDQEVQRRYGVRPDLLRNNESGYKAGIYESDFEKPNKIVIAYAGTEDKLDIDTDVNQGVGQETDQYNKAMRLSETVAAKAGTENVETTGHSLGGGLASAGSAVTGADGTTLNPAGLHRNTPLRRNGISQEDIDQRRTNVQVYRSSADPLNNVQNNRGAVVNVLKGLRRVVPERYQRQIPDHVRRAVDDPNSLPPAYGVQHEVKPAPEFVHKWSELISRNGIEACEKNGSGRSRYWPNGRKYGAPKRTGCGHT